MPKQKHTHKYERVKLGKSRKYQVYKCQITNCSHYLLPGLAEGRESICWGCGSVFVLRKDTIILKKPICDTCRAQRAKMLERMKNLPKEETA